MNSPLSRAGNSAYVSRMVETHCDILISGGGVAGLTAAAAFGEAGFDVMIVDPMPPITSIAQKGADLRTTAFLQPAQDFLARAGLWDRLEQFSTPLATMAIVDASKEPAVRRAFEAKDISDAPFGWNLPNWLLRREMLARIDELGSVDFRSGVGFKSVVSRTSAALVRLSDGAKVHTKLVIGADGRGSAVRKAADIGVKTTHYGQSALTFAVTHETPHDNISTEVHKSGGPFTLVPLPDHEGKPCSAVVWMTNSADAKRLANLDETEFNAEATFRSSGVLGHLSVATRRTVWPIISQIADRLIAPRTALVAEAAHVMPPIGAQGLNMSLSDLSCLLDLSEQHRNALGENTMLDAYQRARHADVKLRVAGIDMLNRASIAGNPVFQDMRRWGVQALHDIKPVRTGLMRMGLGAKG